MNQRDAAFDYLYDDCLYLPQTAELYQCHYALLFSDKFLVWPGSIGQHHAYEGGLVVHTAEVLRYALKSAESFPGADLDVLRLAALWHDAAKTRDYEKKDGVWVKAPHYDLMRHVAGSFGMWCEASVHFPQDFRDAVGHCILAHHGRREWGSPVEPQTLEAQLLHNADMMSARYGATKSNDNGPFDL
jgi:3'-5' exoribonuclease